MLMFTVFGLIALVIGAELLVRGSSRLASAFGISPLIIGLTVVAFGTSAPEMAVSISSSLSGRADIAVGNVVGSNIFNVLFILGLSALIVPLVVDQKLIRFDVPLMIGVSILVMLLSLDQRIGRLEGAILFAGLLGYTGWCIVVSQRESAAVRKEYDIAFGSGEAAVAARVPNGHAAKGLAWQLGLIVAGLVLLVLGRIGLSLERRV